jgi:hypothetical protein
MSKHPYIYWSDQERARLRQLALEGLPHQEIANKLTVEFNRQFTLRAINLMKASLGLTNLMIESLPLPLEYFSETLPMDDYTISCDYHAPYFSERAVNVLLFFAQKYRIKKHIIAGDLFDMNFAKHHPATDGEEGSTLDSEANQTDPLIKALSWFDETFFLFGNHETRVARITDMRVQTHQIIRSFGIEPAKKKFKISVYDKVYVGKTWLVVHPASYSQISGSVAVRLAEKFHRNVLSAHGHFASMRRDRSGLYECYDLGGMFDTKKIAYINLHTTTHPAWNGGFGILKNGHFRLIDPAVDPEFWW